MDADPSMMPRMDLFPRIARAAHFARRLVHMLPESAPDYLSSHYRAPEAPVVPVEVPEHPLPFLMNGKAWGIEDPGF
jgi:hypothetical protein